MMDDWSLLCKDDRAERLIVSRIDESGLSTHMQRVVQKQIEKPSVQIGDLERSVYSCVITSGRWIRKTTSFIWSCSLHTLYM